ncbi:MAG: S-layer homology domain-containing protein [Oscillospiraceae bacterium]|nr:S-layer homology domain-containing protein [Oscillospiraceae bacterium]
MKNAKKIAVILLSAVLLAAAGVPALAAGTPSAWAADWVDGAIELGLVPQSLQSDYTQAATRAEFCALAVAVYERAKGEITGRVYFLDTDDVNVQKAVYAGIAAGSVISRFNPDDPLTREQAAVMLSQLADALDSPLPREAATFTDIESAAVWAVEPIGHVQAAGIMSGVGGGLFAPQDSYTREQSIVTMAKTAAYLASETGGGEAPGDWRVQYIRTDGYTDGAVYPQVTVISSTDENAAILFGDAAEHYTDEFFAGKYLVLVLLEEGSGSIRHRVDAVGLDGEITVTRLIPEVGTDDMAQWHIILELDIGFQPEGFSVKLAEEAV